MRAMKLGYSRPLAIALLIVGLAILIMGISSGQMLEIVLGGLLVVLGVLLLVQPMVVFTDSQIQVRNLFGMTLKRFDVSSPADVKVEGSKLVYVPTGKKIIGLGFGADKSDAEKVRQWASQGASS